MKAVVCKEYGSPDSLTLETVRPKLRLEAGEVRIGVKACGVNFADTLIVAGQYQVKPSPPFSPGMEMSGVVLETGEQVRRCKPGDQVMAVLDYGGFAEQAVAQETDVFLLPETMDHVTAAGFPVAYGTSEIALDERAHLKSGEVLVVHGAAGGVGLTAVEIGKAVGATVIATAGGPDKLRIAAEHGADQLIDYKREDIRERLKALTGGRGADVVYDAVGGDAFDASLRSIAWNGRILIIGFAGGKVPQIPANILLVKNVSAIGVNWGSYRKHDPGRLARSFERLFDWWEEGKLRPLVSATYPLAEAPKALAAIKARSATGKLVLTV